MSKTDSSPGDVQHHRKASNSKLWDTAVVLCSPKPLTLSMHFLDFTSVRGARGFIQTIPQARMCNDKARPLLIAILGTSTPASFGGCQFGCKMNFPAYASYRAREFSKQLVPAVGFQCPFYRHMSTSSSQDAPPNTDQRL